MTDTLTPPPIFTQDEVAEQRADAEREVYVTIGEKALEYGLASDYEYEEIEALLNALGIPQKFWPEMTQTRTYTVYFTANVVMEREVEIEVNPNDPHFQTEMALFDALREDDLYVLPGDEFEDVTTVNDWERTA